MPRPLSLLMANASALHVVIMSGTRVDSSNAKPDLLKEREKREKVRENVIEGEREGELEICKSKTKVDILVHVHCT